jgi:hypothetical protein
MIDSNHPQSQHIFAAGRMEDFLLGSAQRMTLLPSSERVLLLAECLLVVDKMRLLNKEHFQSSQFIFDALNEAQVALQTIANLGEGKITEDKTNGTGKCAACRTPITKHETYPTSGRFLILCELCTEPFLKAKEKLESPNGFQTCFI